MSAVENKAVVRDLYEQIWNAGILAMIAEVVSADRIDHDPGSPAAGEVAGRDELIDSVRGYRAAFPDLHFDFGPQIAEDDFVTTLWTARGTNTGPLEGMPPTGNSVEVTGIFVERLTNGQIVESWASYDRLGLMEQLGSQSEMPVAT